MTPLVGAPVLIRVGLVRIAVCYGVHLYRQYRDRAVPRRGDPAHRGGRLAGSVAIFRLEMVDNPTRYHFNKIVQVGWPAPAPGRPARIDLPEIFSGGIFSLTSRLHC